MKKSKFLLFIIAILSTLTLFACAKYSNPLFEHKEPTISGGSIINVDSGMEIDSYDKEEVYKDQKVISFTETLSGITCTSKAFLGESGIYLYAYVNDPNVYYSDERQFYENDSVEFYIDPNPEYSNTIEHLSSSNSVRTDCVQLRVNAQGDYQTWYGRRIGDEDAYPWAMGYFDAVASAHVEGTINEKNGATGYAVEAYIPYYEMKLDSKPEKVGLLVAFNNIDNREDTARTWYSYKGMSHAKLTSYASVTKEGFIVPEYSSKKELTADFNDEFYKDTQELVMYQVDENNQNPIGRANFKFVLGEDGLYLTALVKDRVYSYDYDGIFSNDGIEILVDTRNELSDTIFEEGVYRFSYDIAGGCQTDKCINGFNDYVSIFNPTLLKTKVESYSDEGPFNYKYQYIYEAMIPYEVLGLFEKPDYLKVAFAVKTPNEKAFILDRRDGEGNMEGQDWLWIDKHYPQNPSEYYLIIEEGVTMGSDNDFEFDWSHISETSLESECPTRYNYKAYASDNGLYINMTQHVDNYCFGTVKGDWLNSTHVEMEIWNHCIGYSWDGTYFAFFPDGSYYVNNDRGISKIVNQVTITKDKNSQYLYTINYEIYIGFDNNIENPTDGPYGYVKFMSHTPNEGDEGYETASMITKDENRILWTDDCNSYGLNQTGIYMVDKNEDVNLKLDKYDVISGNYKVIDNKLVFTEFDSLVLNEKEVIGSMTLNTNVLVNSNNPAGIIFDYKDGNYFYFAIDNSTHEVVLYQVLNGKVTEIERNYISASYRNSSVINVSLMIEDGKYYCTFFNTMYFTGSLVNNSNKFGFASSVPGAQFYNVSVENQVTDVDVDTLIIGHSYTELWTDYKNDLVNIGLSDNVLNIGISGSHSIHWNKLAEEILTYNPELLIYNIGINDLFYKSSSSKEIVENVKALLLSLKENKDDLEVALLSLNHCVTSGHIASEIIETNGYLKELAEDYSWIKYVDLEDAFSDVEGNIRPELFTDGLHPTAEAYKNVVIPAIAKSMNLGKYGLLEKNWESYQTDINSDSPERYQIISHTSDDGLYIKIEQYVNNVIIKEDPSDWNSTHVEILLFNGDVGYGWEGTYLAFFANESYYINNEYNCNGVFVSVEINKTDDGSNYKYKISYNIYIAFPNNLANPQDGSYAYCKFMFYTPEEDDSGYENSTTITQDGNRTLWTDKCESYEIHANGITRKDGEW